MKELEREIWRVKEESDGLEDLRKEIESLKKEIGALRKKETDVQTPQPPKPSQPPEPPTPDPSYTSSLHLEIESLREQIRYLEIDKRKMQNRALASASIASSQESFLSSTARGTSFGSNAVIHNGWLMKKSRTGILKLIPTF